MNGEFEKKIKRRKRNILITGFAFFCILIIVFSSFKIEGASSGKRMNDGAPENKADFVTIEIRCDQLANDLSKLKRPELKEYIPQDGIILEKTTCSLEDGDTVFDVLDRVCRQENIQIEYSYTPGYDSYYVEGINYIYEFDGGKRSGWTYMVNNAEVNYGCSQYVLTGNEEILWEYVCSR